MEYSFGTDEYIQDVIDKYSITLIRLAYTYVKNQADAEDIVQDTFVSLIRKGIGFESQEHEKAWLIRVTVNKCKNTLKSAWNRKKAPLDEDISYLPKEESDVLSAVCNLPSKYRSVIHLYYYEDYSINEIAVILKRKPATVGTWLSRARNLLKENLKGGFHDVS